MLFRRRVEDIALLTIPYIFQNRVYVPKFTHSMKELRRIWLRELLFLACQVKSSYNLSRPTQAVVGLASLPRVLNNKFDVFGLHMILDFLRNLHESAVAGADNENFRLSFEDIF